MITIIFTVWIKPGNGSSPKFSEHEIIGGGFYIPKTDIFEPGSHGFKIFKSIEATCYKEKYIRSTKETIRQYKSTSAFCKSVTAETGISLELQGKFTMGLTLDAKTKHLSEGSTDIQGMSIDISTILRSIFLDDRCFKLSSVTFTDEFMKLYDSLPVVIEKPWLSESWLLYDQFIKPLDHILLCECYMVLLCDSGRS